MIKIKKGCIMLAFSICFAASANEKFYSNANVMERLAPRHRRHRTYSTAEMFRMDMPGSIRFHSINMILDGTLGWASSNGNGFSTPVSFGKIYIRGLYIPQGNVWFGPVYMTGRSIIVRQNIYPEFQLKPLKKN